MINNKLSLALSMQSNKGVYALLLGSGISHSAKIKTGWGIIEDLCSKLQFLQDEKNTNNPIDWYEEKYGEFPRYDDLLEQLCKTTTERNGILEQYFVPTEDEVKEEIKVPTKAHHAIAKLVKKGYIKVILTTNFDRLMEQALEHHQVNYQVVHDESSLAGIKPYIHSKCTIIKVNGDYKDVRFKNIENELNSYPENMQQLLKRIFDEFGFIISGWSADWDKALTNIITSIESRRYSWYWHSMSENVTEGASGIIRHRDATLITDPDGADSFFLKLLDNVESLETLQATKTLDYATSIANVKKYLSTNRDIDLNDLVLHETKRIQEFMNTINVNDNSLLVEKNFISLLNKYNHNFKNLCGIIATITYYGKNNVHKDIIINTLQRLTRQIYNGGHTYIINMQYLPLVSILYASGISAVLKKDYELLNKIFTEPINMNDQYRGILQFIQLSTPEHLHEPLKNLISKYNKYYLPGNEYMFETMNPIFNHLVVFKKEYDIAFDIFEFLLSLKISNVSKNCIIGRFAYSHNDRYLQEFITNGYKLEDKWAVLTLLNNNVANIKPSLEKISKAVSSWNVFGFKNYTDYYQLEPVSINLF